MVEGEAKSALDGPNWQIQSVGDLRVAEPSEVGQLQGSSLRNWQTR